MCLIANLKSDSASLLTRRKVLCLLAMLNCLPFSDYGFQCFPIASRQSRQNDNTIGIKRVYLFARVIVCQRVCAYRRQIVKQFGHYARRSCRMLRT